MSSEDKQDCNVSDVDGEEYKGEGRDARQGGLRLDACYWKRRQCVWGHLWCDR